MPENERRVLVVRRHVWLIDRAADARCTRLNDGRTSHGGVSEQWSGRFLFRVANAEIHRGKIFGPSRRSIEADLHPRRRARERLRVDDDSGGRATLDAGKRNEST